jgi:hypothetical protein
MTYLVTRSNRVEEDLIDQLFNSGEKRWRGFSCCWPNTGKRGASQGIGRQSNRQPGRWRCER